MLFCYVFLGFFPSFILIIEVVPKIVQYAFPDQPFISRSGNTKVHMLCMVCVILCEDSDKNSLMFTANIKVKQY